MIQFNYAPSKKDESNQQNSGKQLVFSKMYVLKWYEPKKIEIPTEIWYNNFTENKNTDSEEFLMNIITQEAKKCQAWNDGGHGNQFL